MSERNTHKRYVEKVESSIHPSVSIFGEVIIGRNCVISPNVVIYGPAFIGSGVFIGTNSVLGAAPEYVSQGAIDDLMKDKLEDSETQSDAQRAPLSTDQSDMGVVIGDRVIIRESCVIHRGISGPTKIASGCYIHSRTGVNHDCELADGVILAPAVSLAGGVRIGAGAQVGMAAAIHQGVSIGPYAMLGMNAAIIRDCPPLALCLGVPGRIVGANIRKLKRWGVAENAVRGIVLAITSDDKIPTELLPTEHAAVINSWVEFFSV